MTTAPDPSLHTINLRSRVVLWVAAAVSVPVLIASALPASANAATHPAGTRQASDSAHTGGPNSGKSSNQIDVLTATREEVTQKIQQLDAQYAEQQTAVSTAEVAVELANEAVGRARARVTLAENEVELARKTVRAYAVEAYITPPAQDALRVLSVGQSDDASYANEVIKIMADDRHKVVDTLVGKRKIAADESATADAAAAAAADQVAAQQAQLDTLEGIRSEQESLGAELDNRLNAALAEAAALAEIDRQMAAELAAQETALRKAANTPSPRVQDVALPAGSTPAGTVPGNAPATETTPGANPSGGTPATSPPRTTPPPPPPVPTGGGVATVSVTSVGGITVNVAIASQVRGLLDAATAAGLSLRGGGYRSSAAQIATRQANCGLSYYEIYQKPASQCSPPTAIPGRSMHEQGLAIDFTSGGALITSRSNPAFIWLSQNAGRFGLRNLPSEPWHWSTNGN